MNYIVWSALASLAVISLELLFRRGLVWHEALWLVLPAAVLANFLIYKLVTTAPTYVLAFPAFGLFNLGFRIVASEALLHEPVRRGSLAAVVLLGLAIGIGHWWR